MNLFDLKWLAIIIIFIISVASGFATLGIVNKYKKWISSGEALASGIFLGAAFFHLLPAATSGLTHHHAPLPLLQVLLCASASFLLLLLLEHRPLTRVGPLLLTLSVHAFLTGLALGISLSTLMIVSLLVAIMAHKSFEVFALVINLHRHIKHNHHVRWLFIVFACVTPFGILLGNLSSHGLLPLFRSGITTAYINAICSGTFIYVATVHGHHDHHPNADGYQKYVELLATLAGILLMGILAFWI